MVWGGRFVTAHIELYQNIRKWVKRALKISSPCLSQDSREGLGSPKSSVRSHITQWSSWSESDSFKSVSLTSATLLLASFDNTIMCFEGNSPMWERLSSRIYLHSHLNIFPIHWSLPPNSILILLQLTVDCLLRKKRFTFFFFLT